MNPEELQPYIELLKTTSPWAVAVVALLVGRKDFFPLVADILRGVLGFIIRSKVDAGTVDAKLKMISNDNHHELLDALKDVKEALEETRRDHGEKLATIIAKLNGHSH